jgi:hypothetical protein
VAPTAWADSAPKGHPALSQSEKAGRSSAYTTALAQLSLSHSKLRETSEGKADIYREVQFAAKKVFSALSLSGVVSSAAPEGDELELEWVHGECCCAVIARGMVSCGVWGVIMWSMNYVPSSTYTFFRFSLFCVVL